VAVPVAVAVPGSPFPLSSAPAVALGGVGITVPASIKPGERRPFVLYLHGLGASGRLLVSSLGVAALAEDRRFVYAAPDGAQDSLKRRFWNAWAACCDMEKTGVDHVGALRGLLAQAAAHPQVDPQKLFVVGFSNGGFMAHRLACEVEGIAGIASMAGAGPMPEEACTPRGLVAVLQVHGDADDVISFQGGHPLKKASLPRHPSAPETVAGWASRNGCSSREPATTGTLDFEERIPEEETRMGLYTGCKRPVALWTVRGGNHYIGAHRKGQEAIFNFLEKNAR
jgi:polyhydroxybutyrate depolymerase